MTLESQALPGQDIREYLTSYPQELAFGADDAQVVFDRHHTADFILVNDGQPLDRSILLAHVRASRKNLTSVQVEVHEALVTAHRVAARYTLTAVMRKSRVAVTEIYMFGLLAADGRLQHIDQVTRIVPGPGNRANDVGRHSSAEIADGAPPSIEPTPE